MFTYTLLNYLSLVTSHLVTDFILYGNTHLRWIGGSLQLYVNQPLASQDLTTHNTSNMIITKYRVLVRKKLNFGN